MSDLTRISVDVEHTVRVNHPDQAPYPLRWYDFV